MDSSAPQQPVLYERRDAVALVTLNRPAQRNAFTEAMHHALWAALDAAEADAAVRALVLTGAGPGFCAGADLSAFDLAPGPDRAVRADPGPIIERAFNPTARRLMALRMPTVAAVQGVAAGAGVSLAMCCDIALASEQARFIQAFSRIGLVPDAGGSWLLPRRVGLQRALALALTGDPLPARQAADWGLVWQVIDGEPAACVDAALALATRLAQMPTRALVATRQLLREGLARDFDAQLDAERDLQSALGRTHDYLEGVTAFLDKRAPRFIGG